MFKILFLEIHQVTLLILGVVWKPEEINFMALLLHKSFKLRL